MARAALYFVDWNSVGLDRYTSEVSDTIAATKAARDAIKASSNPGAHALIWHDGRHVGTLSRTRNGSIRFKAAP